MVDARDLMPGRKLLISPVWVERAGWENNRIYIDLTVAEIKDSPEYRPDAPISRDYEGVLYNHYGKPKPWL